MVTWGDRHRGADSDGVRAQLTDVQQIYSNQMAFAAVKSNGRVVTWGAHASGFSDQVQAQLDAGVEKIYSAADAFCAVKATAVW